MKRTSHKLLVLGALYLAQGLPFGFFTQALPAVMRREGLSLRVVGMASLLALPWGLKFLWAPLVDRHYVSAWGRRKSWIVPLQWASVAVLGALALLPASSGLEMLAGGMLLLNLLSATQDVATDGWAVDLLQDGERGLGNGVQVAGYRVGMVLGGGLLLALHPWLGLSGILWSMAALLAVVTVVVMRVPEPASFDVVSRLADQSMSLASFTKRPGGWSVLAVVFSFKCGDALAQSMLRPFLIDRGATLAELGWTVGTVGFASGLLGALLGGGAVGRLGTRRALLGLGAWQTLSIGGYALVAAQPDASSLALTAACAFEHFAGGAATVALFTWMMQWCRRETAATDYTVQASTVVVATGLCSLVGGFVAQRWGYVAHFGGAVLVSLLGTLIAWWLGPRVEGKTPPAEIPTTLAGAAS